MRYKTNRYPTMGNRENGIIHPSLSHTLLYGIFKITNDEFNFIKVGRDMDIPLESDQTDSRLKIFP